jgi:hypothetical protein
MPISASPLSSSRFPRAVARTWPYLPLLPSLFLPLPFPWWRWSSIDSAASPHGKHKGGAQAALEESVDYGDILRLSYIACGSKGPGAHIHLFAYAGKDRRDDCHLHARYVSLWENLSKPPPCPGLSLLRLVFLPVLGIATTGVFHVAGIERTVLVLMFSMPLALSMIVLSERYDFYKDTIASLILISSLSAGFYLNLWLMILQ